MFIINFVEVLFVNRHQKTEKYMSKNRPNHSVQINGDF